MSAPGSTMPVASTDRVSDVLARDESLVDVFARHAPHFAKLRNRAMRHVMARLVTVEQAARTAGVSTDLLLRDLNLALGVVVENDPAIVMETPAAVERAAPSLVHPADAPVVELDVREALRSGEEPFSKIMAAVAALGANDVLHLRAIFEPAPLFAVLAKRGFAHEVREHASDDWSIWFWRPANADARAPDASTATASAPVASPASAENAVGPSDAHTLWLDVRGLEPPEPLMRTLAALETLEPGRQLIQVNARVPQFLFPMLAERGYACELDESHADRVFVRIWRPD